MIFDYSIAGIPCRIRVDSYEPIVPATWDHPEEGGDFEFTVLDRRGYPAPWLERKVTPSISDKIFEHYEGLLKNERRRA